MEKNTLLAIVLAVVVMIVFSVVQGIFFAPTPPQQDSLSPESPALSVSPVAPGSFVPSVEEPESEEEEEAPPAVVDPGFEQIVRIDTDILSVVLTNAGGNIASFRLNRHMDGGEPLDMIFSGESEATAFELSFGGPDALPRAEFFDVRRPTDHSVIFSRYYSLPDRPGAQFRLEKEYRFHPGEYMFELIVRLDGGHLVDGFYFGDNAAYTLSFGPQIGPRFESISAGRGFGAGQGDFRQYFSFQGGRGRTSSERANGSRITTRPQWAAIAGQYFALIAIPLLPGGFDLSFTERPEPGVPSASRLHIIRPPVQGPRAEDHFRFFLGPRSLDVLQTYNTGNNAFGITGMQLTEMAGNRGFFAPLERVLLWILNFFYGLARNYGVAILLLTLLVRIALFPLTKKQSESMMRMQAFAPKIKELQEKYKDNKQKLNLEMMELYKKEGYNPLKGCLPMLLQFPIFIAMFNLFRTHFELRGAMFIPGWIPDLSLPESIWNFPPGVVLPILGWTAIRLLPFVQAATQILSMKIMQTPDQKSNKQMRVIMYIMPVVFFFILYDMPSGLLVYWTFTNALTMVQHVALTKYLRSRKPAPAPAAVVSAGKKASGAAGQGKKGSSSGAVTPPPKKRKKR